MQSSLIRKTFESYEELFAIPLIGGGIFILVTFITMMSLSTPNNLKALENYSLTDNQHSLYVKEYKEFLETNKDEYTNHHRSYFEDRASEHALAFINAKPNDAENVGLEGYALYMCIGSYIIATLLITFPLTITVLDCLLTNMESSKYTKGQRISRLHDLEYEFIKKKNEKELELMNPNYNPLNK